MAWHWWLILIGVLITVELFKIVITKKYNQKKDSNNRPKDYEDDQDKLCKKKLLSA